ncbi:MAG TPA: hypothetical protein VM101_15505 [Flavitalea sp.]|nr:hypothetical protein [Flavitalea sp.]
MTDFYKKIAENLFILIIFFFGLGHFICAQQPTIHKEDAFKKETFVGKQNDGTYLMPTSQIIDTAGTTITFSGRPMDLALNPDETILAVNNLYNIVFF